MGIAPEVRKPHAGRDFSSVQQRLIRSVCHEMRGPLAAIDAYSELLEDQISGSLNGQQLGELRCIAYSSRALERMVQNLSDLAHAAGAGLCLQRGRVDLMALIDQVRERMAPAFRNHNVRLHLVCEDLPVLADSDARRLRQVLENLLEAALHSSTDGARVELRATADGAHVRLEVHDQGDPLPAERLEDSLWDLEVAEPEAIASSAGLEVAGSQTIAEALGGSLQTWNRRGGGVGYRVDLPIA